jgi:RHS repeat-associated protein
MQDPKLVADSSTYKYIYVYDNMGRKTSVSYPPDSAGNSRSESFAYDSSGRLSTFTKAYPNQANLVQTLAYDALNRTTSVSWNDSGLTPTVTCGYDIASRTISIVNANATIARDYFNDNLLKSETTTYADSTARNVAYTYNANGSRGTIQYPASAYSFTYDYTARNQLWKLNNSGSTTIITYVYDLNGNLQTRTPDNSTHSDYVYDALDRVTNISHVLNGTTRTVQYDYDNVSNRKWTKRGGGSGDALKGDVFGYDLNDQVTAVKLSVSNPDTTPVGNQTVFHDANGNRTTFAPYGQTDVYSINNLNQYSSRINNQGPNQTTTNASYDRNGNMITGLDGSSYTYDSQNRLLTATKGGSTEEFKYDGLNRQVSRKIGAASPLYNVYDGWDLIAEYQPSATTPLNAYLHGVGGPVKLLTATSSFYYYQDASGSTSHLAASNGQLSEWYRYDLQGMPFFYNASDSSIPSSVAGIRHLFTGQQWYSGIGLYDLRNRYYSPDIARFLQGDPIGFEGDATNLYRYCGNNPVNRSDPTGLINPWENIQEYTQPTPPPREHKKQEGLARNYSKSLFVPSSAPDRTYSAM